MKLSQILEIAPALSALASTKLPAKAGYRVAKALNLCKPELKAYDTARLALAESLGTKSEDGQQFKFEGEKGKDFVVQMEALVDEEVDINLPGITIDDLGDIEIEPAHLAALDGIVIKEAAP